MIVNRTEPQGISRLRVEEADVLLENECPSGANYILGYTGSPSSYQYGQDDAFRLVDGRAGIFAEWR